MTESRGSSPVLPRASPRRRVENERRAVDLVCTVLSPLTEIECRKVSSQKELLSAFRLVYEQYLRLGLMKPNLHRMRVTPYHLLPTTEVQSRGIAALARAR